MNIADGEENGVGGSDWDRIGEVRAVGTLPVGVGIGDRRLSEARKVPWSGVGPASEGLGRRGFLLASHAHAFWVTEVLRHGGISPFRSNLMPQIINAIWGFFRQWK